MNYVCQMHGLKERGKRKVTFRIGEKDHKLTLC